MLNDSPQLDRAFQALSDPTRRDLLARLSRGPASVSELAQPLPISLPAVLQHLQALEASGLIATHKAGRVRTCRFEPKALSAAEAWIAGQRAVWEGRLDRFENYVDELNTETNQLSDTTDLKLERLLDAPRDLVWRAWTDPEHIRRWWAPRPYATPEVEIELKPGGKFFTRMTGPDGFDYSGIACVLEVVPGERIIWSTTMKGGYRPNEFTDDGCNGFPFTAIHTFEDAGNGKTRYTATVMHMNSADAEKHSAMGFHDGWGTCAEQLGEVARSLA